MTNKKIALGKAVGKVSAIGILTTAFGLLSQGRYGEAVVLILVGLGLLYYESKYSPEE